MTGYESKKAMAQAKVEGPLHVVCQCDKCKAQPAQEPVAWYHNDFGVVELSRIPRAGWKPLTTPPQRPWVGLDEKDFSAINQSCFTKLQAATSAESILKEKNT